MQVKRTSPQRDPTEETIPKHSKLIHKYTFETTTATPLPVWPELVPSQQRRQALSHQSA